jgi:hypothetical protein
MGINEDTLIIGAFSSTAHFGSEWSLVGERSMGSGWVCFRGVVSALVVCPKWHRVLMREPYSHSPPKLPAPSSFTGEFELQAGPSMRCHSALQTVRWEVWFSCPHVRKMIFFSLSVLMEVSWEFSWCFTGSLIYALWWVSNLCVERSQCPGLISS